MKETVTMTNVPSRQAFDLNNPSTLALDLGHPKAKDVLALVEAFEETMRAHPVAGALPVVTGWNDVTPAIAIQLLLRNLPGANRKVDPATVFYYASQMVAGEWKATGQPMLIDSNGRLVDAQHRLYAIVISGMTIKSFIVTDVEPIPGLFAYIDNARPRTAATALQTSGLNGVSPIIVKVVKIAEEVRNGVYNPTGGSKLSRQSPAQVLALSHAYPNAQKAARSAASDWEEAVTYLNGRKEVVAYMGMRIIDLFGEDKADDFFEEIVDSSERPADSPIAAFRKLIDKDRRDEKPMKKHHVLAAMIKVFNAWNSGEALGRRWMLQVNEEFPVLTAPPAAETETATETAVVETATTELEPA
jgi:hypothetical protein